MERHSHLQSYDVGGQWRYSYHSTSLLLLDLLLVFPTGQTPLKVSDQASTGLIVHIGH
jgi:hypothetical protein